MTPNADYEREVVAGANHRFIDFFVHKHGHPPWIVCGDPEYDCLLDASPNGSSGTVRDE